jgi:Flp pilus assembly protein TadD
MKVVALGFALALAVPALVVPALGDIVHLKDGTSVEGSVRRTRDGYVITDASGKVTTIPADEVKSFELKSAPSAGGAEERLASLRRAVNNLDDLKQIIDRYKAFIAQTKGTPVGNDAEKDLADWQKRQDQKMVKAGKDWVTPEQLALLQTAAKAAAAKAVPLVAAGQLKEAGAIVDQALSVAPASGELLYLKGVILQKQNQTIPARNAFQAAEAQMPDHGPSHNNIAVILVKTRQVMPAMLEFEKAMTSMPQSQTILDNVAEALHALPDEHKNNAITKRVVALFNMQDAALQREMSQKGLYRWGSQWLDAQQYGVIDAQKKAVQEKLDGIQKDLSSTQARISQINQQIQDDQNMMNLMAQQSYATDANGKVYQFPLPQRYYDIQREQTSLQGEQRVKQVQLTDLQRQAIEEQKKMPQPRYAGSQKSFELEGLPNGAKAPVVTAQNGSATNPPAKASATTMPASAPTTRPGGGDY